MILSDQPERLTTIGEAQLPDMQRLRWQCRRGLLELDLLLGDFLDRGYSGLPEQDKLLFVKLLDYPDQLLLEWLMGRIVPADREVTHLVQTIRDSSAD
jgi:antitoxin CptB